MSEKPETLEKCCHKTVFHHCDGCPYVPVDRCLCWTCTKARIPSPRPIPGAHAMTPLVEAMARALWNVTAVNIMGTRDLDGEFDRFSDYDRQRFIDQAIACLRAMAEVEPSETMLVAGVSAYNGAPVERVTKAVVVEEMRSMTQALAAMLRQAVAEATAPATEGDRSEGVTHGNDREARFAGHDRRRPIDGRSPGSMG